MALAPLTGTPIETFPSVPAARRRRLLFGAAVLLALVDGVLLAVWAVRRAREQPVPHESAADPRVARVFATFQAQGLAAALDTLERAAQADSAVLRDAHQVAHALGRQAVTTTGGGATVLAACRPAFASGCYHGVVEAYLAAHSRIDMTSLGRLCDAAGSGERPGPVYECLHGLGHGLLDAVAFDVDSALRYCDELGRPGAGTWCHAGVFMEAVTMAGGTPAGRHSYHGASTHAGRPPAGPQGGTTRLVRDAANPYSPCDRFGDPYAPSCWLFQGFLVLRDRGLDVGGALRACDQAPRGRVGDCSEGVGLQFAGLLQRDDAWNIAQCARGSPSVAPRCAAGVARAFVGMDWSGRRAAQFCRAVPVTWKEACYGTAGGLLPALATPAQRRAWCLEVRVRERVACPWADTVSRGT